MPVIGWLVGKAGEGFISKVDHWVAFVLLGFIGGKMIADYIKERKEEISTEKKDSLSNRTIFVLAIATSIDALAVGVTFAFLEVNIVLAISLITIITFILSVIGVKLGNLFGDKYEKKAELAAFLAKKEGVEVNPAWMFDIQVKRFHEYKRQTMNALAALILYFRLKNGELPDFHPMMILFGGKSAAGYVRAKGTIKLIHEIAKLINNDPDTKDKLRIVFATDYNVSYAEKLIPSADLSEQISTAGTEASGTSNMKFMANGAVTIGTMDGANIEIVEQAGMENNYIFGMSEEEVNAAIPTYDPMKLYEENKEIARVLDAMTDGTLNDKDDLLKDLKKSLLEATYNRADHYMILLDLLPYVEAKLKANADYQNPVEFGRKCWRNMASCGKFSSDRTIKGYAEDIWEIEELK